MRPSGKNARESSARKPKSLYRELAIAIVVLVLLVSVVANLFNYFYFSREAEAEHKRKDSEYAVYLRDALEWPLWNVDDELVGKIGGTFMANEEVILLTIRDDQQRVVYHQEKRNGHHDQHQFAIAHDGQNIGSVEIALSLKAYEERNRQMLLVNIISMLLLIIVLLGAMGGILSKLLRKPVDAFAGAIANMVEGNYRQIELQETYMEFAPIISGFKTMSDAVASRESSLRASEQKLFTILENADACIYLKDMEGHYLFANRPVLDLLHVEMEDIIGFGDEKFFDAPTAAKIRLIDRQVLESGETLKSENEVTVAATGQTACYQFTKLPLRLEDGSIYALCGISIDITERKKAEEELCRYKDHLEDEVQLRTTELVLACNAAEAANRAKSVFLSSMSHELRTPLNAILGFSNVMRKDPLLSQGQRENLDIINRSGEHLLNLINDVLDMAKIEAGRAQVESAPFDLGNLVRDVTDMMHVRAQEKGLQLLVDQSSEFPRYINGDEARLRQVLINLVGNALKFTQHGGVTVRFGLKPQFTPERLLIEVEDSGTGISEEDRQNIFEPFVQLEQTATQKGTGLGLAITRQFVQLMGGTISVESKLGKGSTFRVELPVERVAVADLTRPECVLRGDITGLAPNQREYRILIVEDQLENQLLLAKLMENIGFPVKVAENGEQALALFQSWRPHLIWMDRRMPVMDGLEATQRIREMPGGTEVKIVAVTASAFMEQRAEMLDAGMDDFLRKPYRFNEIYDCLTRQLGVQYTYAEAQATEERDDAALTSQALTVLPPDLRREFHDALVSLEGERIAAAIQQVAPYDSKLHMTLTRLAGNFDYPAILKALQIDPQVNIT